MGYGFLCILDSPYLVFEPKENEHHPNHNRNRSILPNQGLVFETLHAKEMKLSKSTSSSGTQLTMNKADEKLNRHYVTSKLNPVLNHSTPPTVLVTRIRLVQ
jgi:hypothetical protein